MSFLEDNMNQKCGYHNQGERRVQWNIRQCTELPPATHTTQRFFSTKCHIPGMLVVLWLRNPGLIMDYKRNIAVIYWWYCASLTLLPNEWRVNILHWVYSFTGIKRTLIRNGFKCDIKSIWIVMRSSVLWKTGYQTIGHL